MQQYVSDKPNNFRTELGEAIFRNKYALTTDETWLQRCQAVVDDVCGTRGGTTHPLMSSDERKELVNLMHRFKFLPGGRYLYYGGRDVSFFNNCMIYKAEEDTRQEWGRLIHSCSDALMSGAGVGVDYSILRHRGSLLRRTGGIASGPLPLAHAINEYGRGVQQGGSRRSAIFGSLNWQHGDAPEWLRVKDWANQKITGTDVTYAEAKRNDFDAKAPLDFTNISLNYDNQFLSAIASQAGKPVSTALDSVAWADVVAKAVLPETFVENVRMALYNGEPGFSFNFFAKEKETGRNACCIGSTPILTDQGYREIQSVVGEEVNIWNGNEWSAVIPFSTGINSLVKVTLSDGTGLTCTPYHKFVLAGGTKVCADELNNGDKLEKFLMPVIRRGGKTYDVDAYSQGFYAGDGCTGRTRSALYDTKYMCAPRLCGEVKDTPAPNKKAWVHGVMKEKIWVPMDATFSYKMEWLAGLFDSDGTVTRDKHGNGIQVVSVDKGFLNRVRLMLTTLGVQAKVVFANSAGNRALPNGRGGSKEYFCQETNRLLIGCTDVCHLMGLGLDTSRLELHGDAPQRDARRFVYVVSVEELDYEEETFCFTEPKRNLGTFAGIVTGNCTEVASEDDSDVCNLGSVNMAACATIKEFALAVELGAKFLVCGTIRGELPDEKVRRVREKNRRLGLGLMGVHEWLLQRGHSYAMNDDLRAWLQMYKDVSEASANEHCDRFFLNRPVAYRALAPNGTIGTLAGSSTSSEPIFAVAYKRRYIEGNRETGVEKRRYQYYVDSAAQDLMNRYGLAPEKIESALDLAKDPERRIAFQADVQDYVDMAISSTLNMPEWGSEWNNDDKVTEFARIIAKYAPRLRGLTMYPDGARGGQPLTSVPLEEARTMGTGIVFEENSERACKSGVCGI